MSHLQGNVSLRKTLIVFIIFGFKSTKPIPRIQYVNIEVDHSSFYNEGFTINTRGCSIPRMKVEDYSIQNFSHYSWNATVCSNTRQPLLRSNQTHIWVADENYEYYNIDIESKFKCCYRSFHRTMYPARYGHRLDNNSLDEVVYLDCIIFDDIIEAANEFVKVECYYDDKIIHKEFFVFIPKKPLNKRDYPFKSSSNKPKYNVIILGLSSMSRMNFHRTMPNTNNILEELGALELFGYHVVGNSTLDNIMPILTGMTQNELNITCLPRNKTVFDSCPFIWERFKDLGYYTALVEDTARSGIFNSGTFGFSGSPTDYFLHPFIQESENIKKKVPKFDRHLKSTNRFLRVWKKPRATLDPNNKDSLCMSEKHAYRLVLDYIERLTRILKSSKLFGFFWESSLSQYLNAGKVMDHAYERLIRKLNDTGYLNKSIIIFISDHGMGKGGIQDTKQGRLEQRLPLAAILLPPKFRKLYSVAYESLKTNIYRLTTPFDLHETLIDLIDMDAIENYEVLNRKKSKIMYRRGVSLFVPIQSNRTCENATIGNFLCTCHKRTKIDINSSLVRDAVRYVMTYLNSVLKLYHTCVQLDVDEVLGAEEMWPSYAKELEWREFKVALRFKPGAREYEALIRRDDEGWSLMSHIRKLDDKRFNERSYSLENDLIKWYCE